MSIDKIPSGTRGGRSAPSVVARVLTPLLVRVHRRSGDSFRGMDLLYLTTVGAKSGTPRTAPVARFPDGDGGWLVVASAGGATQHPAWYLNIVAHPDQVEVEIGGTVHKVTVRQLEGDERERAWAGIVAAAPGFAGYESKTDRLLPVLRLTPLA